MFVTARPTNFGGGSHSSPLRWPRNVKNFVIQRLNPPGFTFAR